MAWFFSWYEQSNKHATIFSTSIEYISIGRILYFVAPVAPSLTLILPPRASLYRKGSQRNLPRDRVCDNIFHLVPEAVWPHGTGNQFLFGHWRPAWSFAITLFKLANAPLWCPNKVLKCYIMTPSEHHCLQKGSQNRQSMLQKAVWAFSIFHLGASRLWWSH